MKGFRGFHGTESDYRSESDTRCRAVDDALHGHVLNVVGFPARQRDLSSYELIMVRAIAATVARAVGSDFCYKK